MADKQALEARVDSFAAPNSKLTYDMMAAVVAVFPIVMVVRPRANSGQRGSGQQGGGNQCKSKKKSGRGGGGRSGQQGGGNQHWLNKKSGRGDDCGNSQQMSDTLLHSD
jgi:hypothetical protein